MVGASGDEGKCRDSYLVNQVCGLGNWGLLFSDAVESVGGILCYWDKLMFEVKDCVVEQWFVAIKGCWVDNGCSEGLICIYAPTDGKERKSLFEDLTRFVL